MGGLIQPGPVSPRQQALKSFLTGGNLFKPAPSVNPTVNPAAAGPVQPAATPQQRNHALLTQTAADVHGGRINEQQGAARLRAAGFPEHENPYSNETAIGAGGVIHAVARPLGLSRSSNIRTEADWRQAFVRATGRDPTLEDYGKLGRIQAGVVTPGTGLLAQFLGGIAQKAVYSPGGGVGFVEHPIGTAEKIGHSLANTIRDPGADPANTAFLALAGLSGIGAGVARLGAARTALTEGAGLRAAATRPGHTGGSLLHTPEPGTQRIYAPGGRPEAVAGPLEQAQQHAADLEGKLAANLHAHQAAGIAPSTDTAALETSRKLIHAQNGEPPPELNMAIRLGRERARLEAQLTDARQAVQDHTAAQAGLSRTETAQGPRSAVSVDRLLPRNVLARQVSRARNTRIQKALLRDEPVTPRTAVGRAYRSIFSPENTVGRELRARQRFEAAGAGAPVTQLSHATEGIIGHGITQGEHTAIGVTAIEGKHAFGGVHPITGIAETPADVIARHIATHERYIEEGKGADANAQHIADLKDALQHLENPSPRFLRAVELSRRVSNGTAQQLIDEKLLTPETEAGRRASIASLYTGDRYNAPTPGRLGVSPALDDAQARAERLQKAYDRLEQKGMRGGYVTSERPRTVQEAQTRMRELEPKVEGFRQGVAAKMFHDKLTPEERTDQLNRNTAAGIAERQAAGLTKTGMQAKRNEEKLRLEKSKLADLQKQHEAAPSDALAAKIKASRTKLADLETRKLSFKGKRLKSGASSRKAIAPTSTVKEDRMVEVDKEIDRLLEQHKTEPWAQAAKQQLDELDTLRYALRPQASFMEAEAPAAADLGHTAETTFRSTRPTLERRGGALSVAKDELEQRAEAAANRVEPTGFRGQHEPPEGSFFFPLSRRYTDSTPRLGPSHARTEPGEYGLSPANERGVVSSKPFTGESVSEARGLNTVARSIAQRATNVNRLVATKRLYGEMWRAASPVRRSEFDVPMRYTREIQDELRDFFSKLADDLHGTPDEALKADLSKLERLKSIMQPEEHADAAVGSQIPGVRWVDRRFLKSNGEVSVRGPIEKFGDAINNPVRAIQLYGRPAYILNLAGNLGMQGVTEGARVFPSLQRAVLSSKEIGADDTALVDGYMGSSRSRSFDVNTGLAHDVNHRLAETWNQITDLYSRRGAFYTEAARAGYKTPEQIRQLLHDPEARTKLQEVVRRSNRNIVDYDSLTPIEKNTIRRLIYFYPWVSRGTLWALRTVVEHPYKTLTLEQLGQIGADNAHKQIGPMPKWAEQLGLIPVGSHHGDLQGVLNPSSINTPSTAVQLGEALVHPLDKQVGIANLLTPAYGASVSLTGSGAGESPPQGAFKHLHGWLGPFGNMLESLPPVQALRRSGIAPGAAGPPSKTYPDTGVGPALGPFTFGGLYKRDVSRSALAGQAEKEKPAAARAADRVQAEQHTLMSEARRVKLLPANGQLPPDVVKAYTLLEQREVAYAKLGAKPTQMQRLQADLDVGQRAGVVTAAEAREWTLAAKQHPGQVAKARRWLTRHRFGGELLTQARVAVRTHGGDLKP